MTQGWNGKSSVKNKAIKYEEDGKGIVNAVLYLCYKDKALI